ncbi:MAG: apolipoprotein N-acyltransferase [Planctomycetes bacterium]|nr:apolipoprotein N-acyltransferase [Planctomycetota bacterium]
MCWLSLVRKERLPGRRPYLAIWAAAVIHWALVMQGIRLAHWANYFGLLALSCYLGIYLPLFVALTRSAVHRWKLPLILAAPVAWTGIELGRGYGPLGFSMALLGHSQVDRLTIIQIADVFGAYTVGFVIVFVAAGLTSILPSESRRATFWPVLPVAVLITVVVAYGKHRLAEPPPTGGIAAARIALIQGSIDTKFDATQAGPEEYLAQYDALTEEARHHYAPLDLVVWPESMFPVADMLVDERAEPVYEPPWDAETIRHNVAAYEYLIRDRMHRLNQPRTGPHAPPRTTSWLLGTTTWQFGAHAPRRYNAAILVDPDAKIVARYYKMHPLMFGEFLPFGDVWPWLYRLSPLPNGLTPGPEPVAFELADLTIAPSICFESTMPHLIRRQVVELTRRGMSPDVLVNLTNDGWFWGSSILDLHFACAVFRAVELRRPFLVAANTGFSASIDGNGRVLGKGPRRDTASLLAEVRADGRGSLYECVGDGPAALCTFSCLALALTHLLAAVRARFRRH